MDEIETQIVKLPTKAIMKTRDTGDVRAGAVFSPCEKYRYLLWREWDTDLPQATFIGLNPSTADERQTDPTVAKCIEWARRWGCGRLNMLNIFAYRATDPTDMKSQKEPVGKLNDTYIQDYLGHKLNGSGVTVAAWGNHGSHLGRSDAVRKLLTGVDLRCLFMNKTGEPKHPLYISYATANTINDLPTMSVSA